jgi:NADH:ubiquinone oxidoreductase subunit 6 (subunit J)
MSQPLPSPLLQVPAGPRADSPDFVAEFWPVLLPVALGFAAVYLLLPRARRYPPLYGAAAGGLALVAAGWLLIRIDVAPVEAVLFYIFSALAIVFATQLITQRNPVHAALSFAMVVLSTCGLFLLQAAPFLMAATIIIYAGAIVVTFLFVIMLAQQAGLSSADQRSREPFLASVAGFVLLGALLCVLHRSYTNLDRYFDRVERAAQASTVAEWQAILGKDDKFFAEFQQAIQPNRQGRQVSNEDPVALARAQLAEALDEARPQWSGMQAGEDGKPRDVPPKVVDQFKERLKDIAAKAAVLRDAQGGLVASPSRPLSAASGTPPSAMPERTADGKRPVERLPAANVAGLGRALFTDYLLAVELAGTLLLVATIGAIAIAGRRTEGLR